MKQLLTSKKGITLLALFITLLLGITIGTIISDGVLSAQEETPVELLQIQGEGSPLLLGESASLGEGFARVANTVEPAVVNISTTAIIRTSGGQGGGAQGDFREFFGDDFWQRFFGPGSPQPQERKATSLGTGVIVDSEGYVLTNYHVVARTNPLDGVSLPKRGPSITLHDDGSVRFTPRRTEEPEPTSDG